MYELEHYPFPLKPLPYAYNALQPVIDARTLHFHHDKHLKTYVDRLNEALSPYPITFPSPAFQQAVISSFGSMAQWKNTMKNAAVTLFGSGWAWTVQDDSGQLKILQTANQDAVFPYRPVLLVDVWEHAYYLQYQNRRADYVENWFRLINWDVVSQRFTP